MDTGPALITKAASTQTYYTIRLLVDRGRVEDAYRAYGYFRWVDDLLDAGGGSRSERQAFLARQQSLLDRSYRGDVPQDAGPQERMLVELIRGDQQKDSGLQAYLRNMMQVMAFDVGRRGRLISRVELNEYTRWLATAVTEAMHYFIGHDDVTPRADTRYLAVTAAHIAHMLRDTFADLEAGYYNIPREVLEAHHIGPHDMHSAGYRAWVRGRVRLARDYFEAGRGYFAQVASGRYRLAATAYVGRFAWLLDTIEREGGRLRSDYPEGRSAATLARMSWLTLASLIQQRRAPARPQPVVSQRLGRP